MAAPKGEERPTAAAAAAAAANKKKANGPPKRSEIQKENNGQWKEIDEERPPKKGPAIDRKERQRERERETGSPRETKAVIGRLIEIGGGSKRIDSTIRFHQFFFFAPSFFRRNGGGCFRRCFSDQRQMAATLGVYLFLRSLLFFFLLRFSVRVLVCVCVYACEYLMAATLFVCGARAVE